MKNSKLRKVLLLACSAVLLVCLSVGATLAYLTSEKSVTNTFTVGKVDIDLTEAAIKEETTESGTPTGNWVEDSDKTRVTKNEYHLMPGRTYAKDPTVTVLKGSEPCYVKMTVTISKSDELDKIFKTHKYDIKDIVRGISTDWYLKNNTTSSVTEDGKTETYRTYEFLYWVADSAEATVVDAKDDNVVLPDLFTAIAMPGSITNAELESISGMEIVVNAYAIQATGFANADDAWAHFN